MWKQFNRLIEDEFYSRETIIIDPLFQNYFQTTSNNYNKLYHHIPDQPVFDLLISLTIFLLHKEISGYITIAGKCYFLKIFFSISTFKRILAA